MRVSQWTHWISSRFAVRFHSWAQAIPPDDHDPGGRIIETTAEEIAPAWYHNPPWPLSVLAGIILLVGGAAASGAKIWELSWPERQHAVSVAAAPVQLAPKGDAETWLLQLWLPTVAAAPYGAWDRCAPASSAETWDCLVVQSRTEDELAPADQRRWRVRVTGARGIYRVLRVRRIQ